MESRGSCINQIRFNWRNIEYFTKDKSIAIEFENMPTEHHIKYRFAISMGHNDGQRIRLKAIESA